MPSARSASTAPRYERGARTAPRPKKVPPRGAALRVRWERVGRVVLLVVLAVVVGLYAQHIMSYLSARSEAGRQAGIVQRLVQDNAALRRQQHALGDPATIRRNARALGMVQAGEKPYVITGLPKH